MNEKLTTLDTVIAAMLKLDAATGERKNAIAFMQSCYGGQTRRYDFDAALACLARLTPEEHQALAEYIVEI